MKHKTTVSILVLASIFMYTEQAQAVSVSGNIKSIGVDIPPSGGYYVRVAFTSSIFPANMTGCSSSYQDLVAFPYDTYGEGMLKIAMTALMSGNAVTVNTSGCNSSYYNITKPFTFVLCSGQNYCL